MEQPISQRKCNPSIQINKHDSKYLSKAQTRKAQFLYENDYFIWNEAEMYLRYHELFSRKANSDLLYDNICKTTRVIFNVIHDVHFSNTGSNVAYLHFYEVLDAWGALSEYLKQNESFPSIFIDWFQSIFDIYKVNDQSGDYVVSYKIFNLIYSVCGLDLKRTNEAYKQITSDGRYKLTFEKILTLLKDIVVREEFQHFSHFLVPKLQDTILLEREEKAPAEVLRNYDYDVSKNIYSNLSDWQSFALDDQSVKSSNSGNSINKQPVEMKNVINSRSSHLIETIPSVNKNKEIFISQSKNIDNQKQSGSSNIFNSTAQPNVNQLKNDQKRGPSAAEKNDQGQITPVFNMNEFKREFKNEFKRSTNNINRILSKSINTLDLVMGKGKPDSMEKTNVGHSNPNISTDSLQTQSVSYRVKQLNNQLSDETRNKIDTSLQNTLLNKNNNEIKVKTIDLKSLSNYSEQQKNRTLSASPRRLNEKSSRSSNTSREKKFSTKEKSAKRNHETKVKISSNSSSSSSVSSYTSNSKLNKKSNSSFSKHNTSLLANKIKQLDSSNRNTELIENQVNGASLILKQNSKPNVVKSSTRIGRESKEDKETEADDEQRVKPTLKESLRIKYPLFSNNNINKSPIHYKIRSSTPKTWLDIKAANKIDIKRNNHSTNESDTLVNLKKSKAKSKSNRSLSSNEPYKSIMNAITLSSLDTLNDIDSEDPSYLIGDVDVYEQSKSYQNRDYLDQNDESITATSNLLENHQDIEFYKNNEQKMYVEQDWSYSLNSTLLSVYDQKLIAEIIRKLKPYVRKCVRREVKQFFEKHVSKDCLNSTWSHELKNKDLFNSSILAKIGDF